jgi:hypothetical protein
MIMAWRDGDWVIGVRRSGAVFAPAACRGGAALGLAVSRGGC